MYHYGKDEYGDKEYKLLHDGKVYDSIQGRKVKTV